MPAEIFAQAAVVTGQLVNYGSSLANIVGTAVDASQNVYIITSAGGVYKETYNAITSAYTESTLFSVTSGSGIAVSSTGTNLYIGTGPGQAVVVYTLTAGTYAAGQTFTGFTGSTIPAVDAAGNVYILDQGTGAVYKDTLAGGAYTQATIGTGFTAPQAIALDNTNSVYVSDSGTNAIYKLTGSGTTYATSTLTISGVNTPKGIGLDSAGDLYIETATTVLKATLAAGAYTSATFYGYIGQSLAVDSNGIVYLNAALQSAGSKIIPYATYGFINFGSVPAGNTGTAKVVFTITGAGTLGTPNVVTQGIANLDFNLGSGSTCITAVVTAGSSCTVSATFYPLASGSRAGAVNLTDSTGTIIATALLGGIGKSPLALFQASVLLKTLATDLKQGRGIFVDVAGNVFLGNSNANTVVEFVGGSTTETVLYNAPAGCGVVAVAIDGAGDLFFNCNALPNIYEYVRNTGSQITIPVGHTTDDHLSVDAAGNLYTTSYSDNANLGRSNLFLKIAAGTHIVSILATAPTNARFVGATTDSAGNVFAPDFANNILYELPAGSSTLVPLFSGTPLNQPHSIAEDAAGNLYVSNYTGTAVYRFGVGAYTSTPTLITVSGTDSLFIDAAGNFFTVASDTTLSEFTRSTQALAYPATVVGTASASKAVVLENDGTDVLIFPAPSAGMNPSISANFVFSPSSTCPSVFSASAPGTLAVGSTCTDVISFNPQQVGAVTGSLIHSDNSLNQASTQTVTLSGTGTTGTPTVTVTNVTAVFGSSPTLTVVISGGGVAPAGAVTFQVGTGATVAATCTAGTGSETCTASYPGTVPVGGPYTITASVAADANYAAATGTGTLTVTMVPATATDTASGSGTYGAATSPVTVAIPYSGSTAPTGAITVNGPNGTTVTVAASTCTAASGVLTCMANLPSSSLPAGANALTVAQAGDGNYAGSTGSGTLTLSKAPATTGDTASGTGSYGAATSLVTVTIPYSGSTAPSGAITVNGPNGTMVTVAASTCTAASGALTCTANLPSSSLPTGANALTVSQAGDANYVGSTGSGTLTLAKAPATTTDSASGTATYGSPAIPVTVSIPFVGSTAPTGNVTVTDSHGNTGTVPASGCTAAANVLTCPVSLPAANVTVGSDPLTIAQAGDSNFSGSTGTGTATITKAPATATDTATGTGTYGSPTTPVPVSIPYSGAVAPTGAVTVADTHGNTVTVPASACMASAGVLTCTATFPTANLGLGGDSLTINQAGDGNYSASTGTGTVTIGQSAGPLGGSGASVQNVTIAQGTATTVLTALIPYSGAAAPSGAVTFTVAGGTAVAATCSGTSSPLMCTATYPTASLALGTAPIVARQAADSNYAAATASSTLTVGNGTVSPVLNSGSKAQDVSITTGAATATLTASIAYTGPAPIGAVTFNLPGGSAVTATCTGSASPLSCTASYPSASLAAGNYTITVTEAADANYPQGSATANLAVTAPGAVISPLFNTASSVGNQLIPYGSASTTLTANIVYTGPAPSGAVNFLVVGGSGSTTPATCTTGPSPLTCTATYPTTSLGVGSYTIYATQAADTNYPAGNASGTLTVTKVSATTSDTVSGSGNYGAATIPATVTIPFSGTVPPTGLITLADTHGNTLTIPASSCTVVASSLSCPGNFPIANVPAGSDPITVSQAGDSNYAGSTGTGSVTINPSPAAANDTATGTGTYGAATSPVTVTIPYMGAVAPTGAITVNGPGGTTVTVPASSCTISNSTLVCTANLPSSTLPAGSNTLTATQAADANHAATTGTGTLTLNPTPASANDTANGAGTYGASTSPVTVTIPYTGNVAPTGLITVSGPGGTTVTVPASSCTNANSTLTCIANLPSTMLPVGSNALTVAQASDPNHAATTGSGTLTINPSPASANDTATGKGTYGAPTSPVTVTIPYTGTLPPTGLITISGPGGATVTLSASTCTNTNATLVCTANLPSSSLPVGADPITVTQAADSNHGATTGSGTLTVAPAAVAASQTVSATGVYGMSTSIATVVIPYVGTVAPTGAVTVVTTGGITATVPASSCTSASGTLTCSLSLPTASVAAGTYSISSSQAADANYGISTGTGTLTLAQSTGNVVTVTPSPVNIAYGAPTATLTATVAYAGAAAPTGGLTFTIANGASVAATCTGSKSPLTCTASYPTGSLAAGTYAIKAIEAADNNYAAASGTGSSVVTADFTFTNSGTTYQSVVPGDTTTFAFALAPVTQIYPGTVTFSISGCPAKAVCTVSPTSEPATAGPQKITLTVVTAPLTATNRPSGIPWRTGPPIVLAGLLPLCFGRRLRRKLGRALCVLVLMAGGLAAMGGLTGCAQHNGFFGQAPADYTITVSATSGGITRSAQVTLDVQ